MKRFMQIVAVASLMLAALHFGSAVETASAASPSMTIGALPAYVAPYASGGSVNITDPCISRRWYANSYYQWYGAYCGSHDSWNRYATYVVYDRYGDFVGYWDCWSTPISSGRCGWR